jgi:hypothetical protein
MLPHEQTELIRTITALAEEIARASPESADKAMRIVALLGEIRPAPDRETVRDVIETETIDTDISDTRLDSTTEAVVRAIKDGR